MSERNPINVDAFLGECEDLIAMIGALTMMPFGRPGDALRLRIRRVLEVVNDGNHDIESAKISLRRAMRIKGIGY